MRTAQRTRKPIRVAATVALLTTAMQSACLAQKPILHQVLPVANRVFDFRVNGETVAKWNGATNTPRPFLFPLVGPSGQSVTRMGHPGAPNHDHHRSIWFAHYKVNGLDFWSENGGTKIQQTQWYAIEDGEHRSRFAAALQWLDPTGEVLVDQDVVFELKSTGEGETLIEIQSDFRPAATHRSVTFEQTNYGILAVRVSKDLSHVFGEGTLTDDAGEQGESAIFERPHRWVDYSGETSVFRDATQIRVAEGLTYFDHPENIGFPNRWHVRDDGWMCASPTMKGDIVVEAGTPLQLRYMLHVHRGRYTAEDAERIFETFADSRPFRIQKSSRPHVHHEIVRTSLEESNESD